jgi:hypothetical protein
VIDRRSSYSTLYQMCGRAQRHAMPGRLERWLVSQRTGSGALAPVLCALAFTIALVQLSTSPVQTLPPSVVAIILVWVADLMKCLVMVDLQHDTR